jgi:hypothetical protein
MNRSVKSKLTPRINVLDNHIGVHYAEIKRTAKTAAKSSNPIISAAGATLMLALNPFWKVTTEPLASQSAQLGEMFIRVNASPEVQKAIDTLALTEVWRQLIAENAELNVLYEQRVNEDAIFAAQPSASSMQDAVIIDYEDFCIVTEQLFATMPNAKIEQLFYNIDVIRHKYSTPTKLDLDAAIISPIPQQNYTSQPITPPIEVFFNGKLLTLGKDYNVTYKKNIEIGEATVTIHGKSEYRGTHTTSFYIALP